MRAALYNYVGSPDWQCRQDGEVDKEEEGDNDKKKKKKEKKKKEKKKKEKKKKEKKKTEEGFLKLFHVKVGG
jgi:hypothetical protein